MSSPLYQQMIINHSREPIGKDKQFLFDHSAEGENPSCGDELTLYLKLYLKFEQQHIENIGFTADACAICTASASLLCQQLNDKNLQQAAELALSLENKLVSKQGELNPELDILTGVSQFPSRVNCALLPWSTLSQIINKAISKETSNKAEESTA